MDVSRLVVVELYSTYHRLKGKLHFPFGKLFFILINDLLKSFSLKHNNDLLP